jgi:hypothetical protein
VVSRGGGGRAVAVRRGPPRCTEFGGQPLESLTKPGAAVLTKRAAAHHTKQYGKAAQQRQAGFVSCA